MNSQMKSKIAQKFFLSLVIVGILINLVTQDVYACTPAPMTPWFVPSIILISSNIPNELIEINSDYGKVILKNVSNYLIRIVIDSAYQEKNGYEDVQNNQLAIFSISDYDTLSVNNYRITSLAQRNKFEDNRPTDVQVPEPQVASAKLLINNQPFYVQMKIAYEINSGYNPHSVYSFYNACRFYPYIISFPTPFILITIIVIILTILAFPIVKKMYK